MADTRTTSRHVHKRPSKMRSIFSSTLSHPAGIRFETQEAAEDVVLLLRRHFATNTSWILLAFLLVVLPAVLGPFLAVVEVFRALPSAYPVILGLFWYLIVAGYALMNFLHWYFNIYILTDRRVIDIDFFGLLFRKFSAAHLVNIEDVSLQQSGFFSSFFDYGDVLIQTAGAEPNFEFVAAPNPDELVRTIGQKLRQAKRRYRSGNRRHPQ